MRKLFVAIKNALWVPRKTRQMRIDRLLHLHTKKQLAKRVVSLEDHIEKLHQT